MRIALSTLFVLSTASLAGAQPKPPTHLEATEVAAQVKPVVSDIERCYLDAVGDLRGAGHLQLAFAIHRTGLLDSVDVTAPGVPARTAHKIDACVRPLVEKLRFPARRSSTTALVPYFFQHTDAPNSGPQLSCWNPKGCKS
jgi:hypothetical protein